MQRSRERRRRIAERRGGAQLKQQSRGRPLRRTSPLMQRALSAHALVAAHSETQALGRATVQHNEPCCSTRRQRRGVRVWQNDDPASPRGARGRNAAGLGGLRDCEGLGNGAVKADAHDAQRSRSSSSAGAGTGAAGARAGAAESARDDRMATASRTKESPAPAANASTACCRPRRRRRVRKARGDAAQRPHAPLALDSALEPRRHGRRGPPRL